MNLNVESYLEAFLDNAKEDLLKNGRVSHKVILLSEEGAAIKDPFNFSNKEAARQVIRSNIKTHNAQMAILIYQAWVSNDLSTFPRIAADRRQAICVYGETGLESMIMLQEFKIDKSGIVTFGKTSKLNKAVYDLLTGLFKP